jgi:AraC family transcriptional activator of pobA
MLDIKNIPKYEFNSNKTDFGIEVVSLEKITIDNKSIAEKTHRINFYQILFFTSGNCIHTVDFKQFKINEYSLIPVHKGQVQSFDKDTASKGFALLFTPEFLVKNSSDYKFLYEYVIFNHSIDPILLKHDKEILGIINSLADEQYHSNRFDQTEYIRSRLIQLLILIERKKRVAANIMCADSYQLYLKFRRKLEKDLNYKLRVKDIASNLNETPKKINEAVKLITQSTAKEYIKDRIILEAKRLLAYSDLSVKEIAYTIGFDEPTNFTKYFKAEADMLPSEYQKSI